jgi:hypothetical protein
VPPRDDGQPDEGEALDREAHPAAAGGDRIRVLDPERLAHQVVDELRFGGGASETDWVLGDGWALSTEPAG